MIRDYVLAFTVVLFTLALALTGVWWFSPQLLGRPADMRVVRSSDQVPPFYENLFERAHDTVGADQYLINDPLALVRAPILFDEMTVMGPNDVLGFRNRLVPNVAEIITIGDSQTYGNNASLEGAWPMQMGAALGGTPPPRVYSMATGGWSAIQYLLMVRYALRFQPKVIVIAFYTGNDALESFRTAYQIKEWSFLRLDPKLTAADEPAIPYPVPQSEQWPVKFADGLEMVFTPKIRLIANDRQTPAVRVGYRIMAETVKYAVVKAGQRGVPVLFTVIPTKELVYQPRIAQEGVTPTADYAALVRDEQKNYEELVSAIRAVPHAHFVDALRPLQQAASARTAPYLEAHHNGHPNSAGYRVIGATVAEAVRPLLPAAPPLGVVGIRFQGTQGGVSARLLTLDGVWVVEDWEILDRNGWSKDQLAQMPIVPARAVASLHFLGVLRAVDPARFGPGAFPRPAPKLDAPQIAGRGTAPPAAEGAQAPPTAAAPPPIAP